MQRYNKKLNLQIFFEKFLKISFQADFQRIIL